MGKWYNKFFVGNPNKDDFSAKDLPKTRVEQYFDVVKLRFSSMVTGNLMYMIFALPLIIFTLYFWFAVAQTEDISKFTTSDSLRFYLLLFIPLYTITGPGKAGLYYCLRNWCWNERATVKEHFWKEFKRSLGKGLFFNFFNATLLYAVVFWIETMMLNAERYPAFKYAAILVAVLAVIYFMSSIYQFPQLVTYNLTIRQIMKNSLIYLIVQFPRTLLAVIIYIAVAALTYYLVQVLLVVMLFMGLSFIFLGQFILSDFIFDKYVNAPEKRRKGMAPIGK